MINAGEKSVGAPANRSTVKTVACVKQFQLQKFIASDEKRAFPLSEQL